MAISPSNAIVLSKMTSDITVSKSSLVAFGVGVCLGASGVVVCRYLFVKQSPSTNVADELSTLKDSVDQLRNEISLLRESQQQPAQSVRKGYYSIHPSSGEDEDDVFLEASAFEIPDERVGTPAERREDPLLVQLDELMEESDYSRRRAHQICEQHYEQCKQNPEFMWRFAYATYLLSQIDGINNKEKKKELSFLAKSRAKEALDITDMNANVHKWYAICLGCTTDFLSTQDKIKVGFQFKKHVERAIEINPQDATLYYLLGRWCLEVYSLTWIERKVAAAIFSDPPSATIDETLNLFLKSDELRDEDSKLKENFLYIAKCYIEKKQNSKAVSYLERANTLPTTSQDDVEAQQEVETLLKKYR